MRTIKINGVETSVPAGAIAYKYADPTEDARWVYDARELAEIRRADPSLLVMAPKIRPVRYKVRNRYSGTKYFTNRKDADKYAAAERRDGWPCEVEDIRADRTS